MEDPVLEKMRRLTSRRMELLKRLEAPARAATNAMKDAGMKNTADPLAEILFEMDAVDGEMLAFARENKDAVLDVLLKLAERRGL